MSPLLTAATTGSNSYRINCLIAKEREGVAQILQKIQTVVISRYRREK
jgi:hypothetical protein